MGNNAEGTIYLSYIYRYRFQETMTALLHSTAQQSARYSTAQGMSSHVSWFLPPTRPPLGWGGGFELAANAARLFIASLCISNGGASRNHLPKKAGVDQPTHHDPMHRLANLTCPTSASVYLVQALSTELSSQYQTALNRCRAASLPQRPPRCEH